jgi:hypothetical protein
MSCSTKHSNINRKPIKKDQKIVDVASAFGGFVFIKGDVLNHPKVRWDTICHDIEKDQSICEHVIFCERLSTITDKRIVLLQNVDTLYRTI